MIKTVAIAAIICLSLAQPSQAPGILETSISLPTQNESLLVPPTP